MEVHAYTRTYVTVRLDEQERWREYNADGRPFMVREINYSGGERVGLRGSAINVDGQMGYIDRTTAKPLLELKAVLQDQITNAYTNSLKASLAEAKGN